MADGVLVGLTCSIRLRPTFSPKETCSKFKRNNLLLYINIETK